jgi:hypothetical protein
MAFSLKNHLKLKIIIIKKFGHAHDIVGKPPLSE